jgi:hypothetical protein
LILDRFQGGPQFAANYCSQGGLVNGAAFTQGASDLQAFQTLALDNPTLLRFPLPRTALEFAAD